MLDICHCLLLSTARAASNFEQREVYDLSNKDMGDSLKRIAHYYRDQTASLSWVSLSSQPTGSLLLQTSPFVAPPPPLTN
jgi:hypothetical protein